MQGSSWKVAVSGMGNLHNPHRTISKEWRIREDDIMLTLGPPGMSVLCK